MLDIKAIRDDAAGVEAQLRRREPGVSLAPVLAADVRRRELLVEEERLRARQNAVGPEMAAKRRAGEDTSALVAEMGGIKTRIQELAELRRQADVDLDAALLDLPNLPHASVPASTDKHDNQVIRTFGAKPEFDFEPQHHVTLAERLGLVDFERGAKVAGSGWPCYRGWGARLEWALINYCVARGVSDGFEPIMPPLAVTADVMTTAGVLPKFADQVYHCERDDLYLIPTAEMVLTGLFGDEIIDEEQLPRRIMAYTPCWRREAGAHGAGERGLLRVHQFNKTERYVLCRPADSYAELEHLTGQVETMMDDLGLHFQTTLLVTGDLAQQAAKTYDVEVWLAGQGTYMEVSSASNCEAYQARRGSLRYRPAPVPGSDGRPTKPEFLHTLNASALATPRLFAAILEAGQQADGSVVIPPVLRPWLDGRERLTTS